MVVKPSATLLSLAVLAAFIVFTDQADRQKRQLLPTQPRIVTQNGHLIFQAGLNHNISFVSAKGGGGVWIDGMDIKTVKDALVKLQPGSSSGNISIRLDAVESRITRVDGRSGALNNLNATFSTFTTQQISMATVLRNRVTVLENQSQGGGSVNVRLTALESRVRRIDRRTRRRQSNQMRRLTNRVTALETQVRNLQTLLTTNECASNPCINGGTCVDMYNGYMCRCPPNFQGPRCDQDVNECVTYAGTDLGCQNGATCMNTHGGFSCQCTADWHGIHCSEQHDDCTGSSHAELCGHGTCVNEDRVQSGQPKYRCVCNAGWTSTSSNSACTIDVDECQRASCSPLVNCYNTQGSFTCDQCPAGYTGNGYTCSDINECEINNGGCSTNPLVDCTNTHGSRICGPCPVGYQGDGVTCSYVDPCSRNNGGCSPNASCINDAGGFSSVRCSCPPGYVGNGRGTYGCIRVSEAGACNSNPCQNDANCLPNGNSYRCNCLPSYTGTNCESVINACDSNPCENGGTCTQDGTGFNCECPSSFTGTLCAEAVESCGGYLRGESGTLQYPLAGAPASSRHNRNCAWVITTSRDKILRITFSSFTLEAHRNCRFDFLQIHDGSSASAHNIGKYCGASLPEPFNTTANQVYFWYKTDASMASDGFTLHWNSFPPSCGGQLNASHGTINSPGYPGNYANNRDCLWTVTVGAGNVINFQFAFLALEQHSNCSFDYLEIRDDEGILSTYCSTMTPTPLQTRGPRAYVRFHTDGSNTDRGFHITYSNMSTTDSGCGGVLNPLRTEESGQFESPNYPGPYQHSAICVWVIRVDSGSKIRLTFTDFDLETSSSCQFDNVVVRDGNGQDNTQLGRFCGSVIPTALMTSSSEMYIEMRTDTSITGRGFQAQWEIACGGLFQGRQGVITSPNYPRAYPHSRTCGYYIHASTGRTIILTFTNFRLESADDCSFDYIELYNGRDDTAPQLGQRYCGNRSPSVLHSTSNMMYIKFVTDSSVNHTGFRATYRTVEQGCGGVHNEPTGLINSPRGSGGRYSHNINCTWYITVDPGKIIHLNFHSFVFEGRPNRCYHDYLDIYDNSTIYGPSKLGRYCGTQNALVVDSTDNVMVLSMRTDYSLAYYGFQLTYTALNASSFCGGSLTTTTGVIMSPNYPSNYPHRRTCEWTITAPSGNQIELNITDFNMESHRNCVFDYLEIRNGRDVTGQLLQRLCGIQTQIEPIMSHGNQLYLKFKSDGSSSRRGFRIEYDGASSGCGADLTSPTGSIISPNYGHTYPHRTNCYWTITAAAGSKINIHFLDFDLESHRTCRFDYLEIRDTDRNGEQITKLCGSATVNSIVSKSNRVWIHFKTDFSVSGRGFNLNYVTSCNTNFSGIHGAIESPNYPNTFNTRDNNCSWVITVPRGNTINVTFASFELNRCSLSRLQIRNGDSSSSPQLGQYCGQTIPATFTSTGNQLFLNFVSRRRRYYYYRTDRGGFRLEWIVNGCGGFLTGSSGTLTSPGYPNPYPHRTECEWHISVATGKRVKLTITDLRVEHHDSCRFDSLEAFSGSDANSPSLIHICGTMTSSQSIYSSGNFMYVKFKSDSSVSDRGFSATFTAEDGGCGGNITTMNRGSLLSPNYPNTFPANSECEWRVTVSEGHTIQLNLTEYNLPYSCSRNYIKIYNGSDLTSPLMRTVCRNYRNSLVSLKSSSNQIYVKLLGTNSGGPMKAIYQRTCGGFINADEDGVITSPSYPRRPPYRSRCVWVLYSTVNSRRIFLTLTHLDLYFRQSPNCTSSYVTFSDGMDENFDVNATDINRYCGNTVPPTHTSYGSSLTVIFSNRWSFGTGFRAVYSSAASSCGGVFTASSGRFTSPRYPENYPMEADCVWQMNAPPGNSISLNFPIFQLDPLGGINDDYLEIRSPDANGQLVGRWFGSGAPPTNATSLHGVWVKFRSNEVNSGQGFLGEWTTVCGGTLTQDSGQLASPLYPARYPGNVDCTWTIIVAQDQQIQLFFETFSMEGYTPACSYDYLLITDGDSESGAQLARLCGRDQVDPIISTSNVISLRFATDRALSYPGFLLSWNTTSGNGSTSPAIPGCGGNLVATDDVQNFSSPDYPNTHAHNLDCWWQITSPPGTTIVVNITDIDMEGWRSRCTFDYIQFFDGPGRRHYRSLGRFCSRTANENPIKSTSNLMGVLFHTDRNIASRGVMVTYQRGCGGVLRQSQGVISSPGYPQNYPANQLCEWRVNVRPGKTINVIFANTFNIQSSANCSSDYVELLNGYYTSSPPLYLNGSTSNTNGRYCGSARPPTLNTTDNSLRIKFVSNGDSNGQGFSLTFSEVSIACGGHLRLTYFISSGYFTSPGYPDRYNHSMDCSWTIIAPPTRRIKIDFEEPFEIEPHPRCNYDFLEFHNGATISSPPLGPRLCGMTKPGTVRSVGNTILARFRTDSSSVHAGFKARYSLDSCGGHITATSGSLSSPSFPQNYPNNQQCEWTISAPAGHYISINFTDFRLQSSTNCSRDVVEIRDGNSTSQALFSGCYNYMNSAARRTIETSDNQAYILFRSDGSGQSRGFRLQFRSSAEVCGGDLNMPSGVITSPNYPNTYTHRRFCRWRITVPQGRKVTLTFTDFQLEPARYCSFDYVMIRNGFLPRSPYLGRYCGTTPPDTVESSGNSLSVFFRSDGSVNSRGFRAEFSSDQEAECGGLIGTAPGNLTSPGFDENGNHSHSLQCIWQLRNPALVNSSIVLWFSHYDLEYHFSCLYDFTEIREGSSYQAPLVDRFCGNISNNPLILGSYNKIVIPTNEAWVLFTADASIARSGFRMMYNFTTCGGTITTSLPGVLTSPNYPNNYNHNDACAWKIVAPEGTRIRVRFTNLTIEHHPICRFDSVQIQNGGYYDSPVIGTFCGSDVPPVFVSQSNEVRIVFKSDSSSSSSGFRIAYSMESGGCGGTYHRNSGNLSSPNYPGSYPHNDFCRWYINVLPGYRVQLNFNPVFDLQTAGANNCSYDFVEIFQQFLNDTTISLGRWCSNVAPPAITAQSNRLSVVFRSDSSTNGHGFTANWTAVCGGLFNSDQGIIYSPGYPRDYPGNMLCNYTISPQGNKLIALVFLDFALENHHRCYFDRLTVWQGNNTSGRELGRYCGSRPDVITGVGSLFMQFRSDASIAGQGFRIHYISRECGGSLTEPHGSIRSTFYGNEYHHNANCTWNITVSPNKIILFRIYSIDIEFHPNCIHDYVALYDGASSSAPRLGKFCGDELPSPSYILTTSNQLYVNFITDSSVSGRGFQAYFQETFGPAQGCGGTLQQSSGTLTSVDIDGNGRYEHSLFCKWHIYVGENKVVTLNFTTMHLERPVRSRGCVYDWVKVYDGVSSNDQEIGAYCGNNTVSLMSSSNVMLVMFKTDGSVAYSGFNATFGEADMPCGGAYNVTDEPQTFSSPDFPANTARPVFCRWYLNTDLLQRHLNVRIQFNVLQLSTNDSTCSNEFIRVRDDSEGPGTQNIKYCGTGPSRTFDSKGQRAQVIYHSTQARGGRFQFTSQIGDCNRNFTEKSGRLTSPNYPDPYPRNIECTTRVSVPVGWKLALYFFDFYIEPNSGCQYDYLTIANSSNTEIARLCNSALPNPLFIETNEAILTFKTDGSVQHAGYQLTYVASQQDSGCGGEVTLLSEGVITSPGYPENSTSLTCQWIIKPPADQRIFYSLTFLPVPTGTSGCGENYIDVFTKRQSSWQNRGRYCQTTLSWDSLDYIKINYVSSASGMGPIFRIKFSNNYTRLNGNSPPPGPRFW